MPATATRADALRLTLSSVELLYLDHLGTIDGVKILVAAAMNGPGTGRLRSQGDGTLISWRAPGSTLFGTAVPCAVDGTYLLEDGSDRSKWVRVQVFATYLVTRATAAQVTLTERFGVGLADDDVTAAEASAGNTETYELVMSNDSPHALRDVKVWIDATVVDLEISDDGAAWVSPTTEAAALSFPDLPAGGTDTLHVRRTIGASEPSAASARNAVHSSYITF